MLDCLVPTADGDTATPVIPVSPDGLDAVVATMPAAARGWVAANGFKAAAGAVLTVPGADGAVASVLLGLGVEDDPARTPHLAGTLATALPEGTYRLAGDIGDTAQAVLGFALAAYRYDRYREKPASSVRLVVPGGVDGIDVSRIAEAVYLTRDLVNTPANDLGPAELAAAAEQLAEHHGGRVDTTIGGDLLAARLPMIHAVGAASDRSPRLVDLTWGDTSAPKLTLVGKGVCFDSGGLNIKPEKSMLLMKKDMGGAANVLGLASMIMDAALPVRLRVLIPAVENAISGNAYRPGDILDSRKGLSVEIGNTDAEGRLVLADALALADEEEPDLLIDLATLTGAARVALGPEVPPFYTDDEALAADLERAAQAVADPLWRLPLWKPYLKMLESKVADINHISSGGFAGSVTAALFLSRFVDPSTSWLHVDIFAWNPSTRPGHPEGGEAQAIRALYSLIKKRYDRR